MSEFGFVLNIDLSLYFDDLRKYSSVFVDSSRCKVVRDIENRIKTLFSLEDDICLVNDKFLIPKFEDIRIVQHCPILRVHKCNFFDEQIHKTKTPKRPCDQTAVNLVQPEKTIDLSCRPKQRLKLCMSQEKYSSTPKPSIFDTENKKRRSKFDGDESESADDIEKKTQKDQQKKKKHKCANRSDDKRNDVGIIDMSFNKIEKMSHDNCFVTSEDLSEDINEQFSSNDQQVSKVVSKSIKRRKHNYYEYDSVAHTLNLESSSMKNTTCSEKSIKKRECNHVDGDNNRLLQGRQFISTISESERAPCNEKKKKNKKSFEHKSNTNKTSVENGYNSIEQSDKEDVYGNEESLKELEKGDKLNKRHAYERDLDNIKQNCKDHIDFLIKQSETSNATKCSQNNCEESIDFDSYENTENDQRSQVSYEDKSLGEDVSIQSSVNLLAKPKRKRKHAKKKKRESQFLSAVGPILNDIVLSKKVSQPSPSASEITKHVFFTDEDFAEEMPIPPTPPARTEGAKQTENDTCGSRDILLSQSCQTNKDAAPSTWQQELLMLASSSSKPIVFHRNNNATQPKVKTETCSNICETIGQNPQPEANENKQNLETEPVDAETFTSETNKTPLLTDNTKEAIDDFRDIAIDVDCINLNNYPIIKKVVNGDIIIFKILKLSEKFEPEVSKTVLAKVLDSSKFPETITFDVIGGCDYKDDMKHNRSLIVDLKWMDLIEPRLFYP